MNAVVTLEKPTYSEVMEDFWVIARSPDIGPMDTVVSVASGGDNVFAAALLGAKVYGVDLSRDQIDLCQLKSAAARLLEYSEFLALLGYRAANADELDRAQSRLAGSGVLCPTPGVLGTAGLVGWCHLETFCGPLRSGLRELTNGAIDELISLADPERRARLWDERVERVEVCEFLDEYLKEDNISGAFIPASAFHEMAEKPFSRFFCRLMHRQLVTRAPRENHYFPRLVTGRLTGTAPLPVFAQAASFASLRQRLERIEWVHSDLLELLSRLPQQSVDALNLSNILDWSDDAHYTQLWREIARVAKLGARVFLRSFLKHRDLPEGLAAWHLDESVSNTNTALDRIGYYSRYQKWVHAG